MTNSPSQQAQFRGAYDTEFRFVWRLLRRLGVRAAALEDLVHDVFVAALRSWHTYDERQPVRPWLYGVTYRIALDHLRKHSNWREELRDELPETPIPQGPSDDFERTQALTLAQKIINGLEVERRAVFVMHELEGLAVPQIAQALEIPLNTAYSRLRLARRDFESAAALYRQERAS